MKTMKGFEVKVGRVYEGDECDNWSFYRVLATTAEEAIFKAKKLMGKGEYVIEISHVITFD